MILSSYSCHMVAIHIQRIHVAYIWAGTANRKEAAQRKIQVNFKKKNYGQNRSCQASNNWKETAILTNDLSYGYVVVAWRKSPGVRRGKLHCKFNVAIMTNTYQNKKRTPECMFFAGLISGDSGEWGRGEDWIGCSLCFKWSHTLCANVWYE